MAEAELINQFKFKVTHLESDLKEKQKILEQYKFIESQADAKIKGMQKIHSEKIKSLLNSIQILKKQKASIEGLSKQHKRSKLIEQLNKQINDQDLVIDILRQKFYGHLGKENGRKQCDQTIVKALNKGPQRIRPITREELRMEIEKLKEVNLHLEKKMKQTDKKGTGAKLDADQTMSQMSSMSSNESQFIQNKTEEMLNRIRELQIETQGLRLQSSSKNKIIEKLKGSVLQGEKYKSQVQLLKNEIQISNRKVFSFERILRDNKEATNKKLIDLYERELKVQELQMIGQEKSDKLKSLNQNHNILLQQIQAQKQQLQAKYEQLKQENEKIILENISNKKHQQNQKTKIDEIRTVNNKQKTQLEIKLKEYEAEAQRIYDQNTQLQHQCTQLQAQLFSQRAEWIQEKHKLVEELQLLRQNKVGTEFANQLMVDIEKLREQNKRLQDIFGSGQSQIHTGNSSDKLLLQRLQAYKRKSQYYENLVSKGDKSNQIQIYNQLFDKYNKLIDEFEEYQANNYGGPGGKNRKKQRKQIIDMTRKQKQQYDDLTSGIDDLNLADIDSEILDNFDTSYEYSIHLDQNGKHTKVPKVSQADRQLLKMISSDLWYFIKDDQLTKKIEEASAMSESHIDQEQKIRNFQQIRKIKNISHPTGHKVKIYQEQIGRLDQMSDRVSVTSAMAKQINNYDSDINIEFEKVNKDAPRNINFDLLKNMSSEIGSDIMVSSVQSGESNIKKKKKPLAEKATKLKFGSKESIHSSEVESELSESLLNSDVSSINISERHLNRIDSDVETDFRKKKRR